MASVWINGLECLPNADGTHSTKYPLGNKPGDGGSDVTVFNLALTSAGRVSFFFDYSELATTGTHTFYVMRSHGSVGEVSVNYNTSGDTHTAAAGSLTWASGEMGIKSFTATVGSKASNGLHTITASLSNPTNGLVLHNGTKTKAYGIIDDGTVPSDSDAVFYDSAAGGGGTGTAASPYNSIYTAIANVGSKRYICGKGTTTIDSTNTVSIAGGGTVNCINVPATRASESDRLFVMNWPGSTWTIQGSGTTTTGFYGEAGQSYHTYRRLDLSALNTTGASNSPCGGIYYRYGGSTDINVEYCTGDNINGATGTNNGAYHLWGVNGGKVWRSTANNIQTAGSTSNENTGGVYTYLGTNLSVQRCEFTNAYHGIYHKRTQTGDVTTSARFNHFSGVSEGISYRESGGTDDGHEYGLIQCNLFESCGQYGFRHWVNVGGGANSKSSEISCNVFDSCGTGDQGAIHFRAFYDTIIYNNIMLDCRRAWVDYQDTTAQDEPIKYADYNCQHGTTGSEYALSGTDYTLAGLRTASTFADNDITTDPLFTNPATDDYTLGGGSPCLATGVDSTDRGIYLTGVEVIGA